MHFNLLKVACACMTAVDESLWKREVNVLWNLKMREKRECSKRKLIELKRSMIDQESGYR